MSKIDITPMFSANFTRAACERAGVKGIEVNDDGSFTVTNERDALGSLMGAVMTLHVMESMVMTSNGDRVAEVADELRQFATNGNLPGMYGSIAEARERYEELADTLDGVAANLKPTVAR